MADVILSNPRSGRLRNTAVIPSSRATDQTYICRHAPLKSVSLCERQSAKLNRSTGSQPSYAEPLNSDAESRTAESFSVSETKLLGIGPSMLDQRALRLQNEVEDCSAGLLVPDI